MSWESFYLICFLVGLFLSAFALLGGMGHFGGHVHVGHMPHVHKQHELGPASEVPPERLVKILRKAAQKGGVEVGEVTEYDGSIAKYLFADVPAAARTATMKTLQGAGADSRDLQALEDLVTYLAHTPQHEWDGKQRDQKGKHRHL